MSKRFTDEQKHIIIDKLLYALGTLGEPVTKSMVKVLLAILRDNYEEANRELMTIKENLRDVLDIIEAVQYEVNNPDKAMRW